MKTFEIKQRDGTIHTVKVDDVDYDDVMRYKWQIMKADYSEGKVIARRIVPGTKENPYRKTLMLNREILRMAGIEVPKGCVSVYKNKDSLDCTRENLAAVTHRDKSLNQTRHVKCESGHRGIYPIRNSRGKTRQEKIQIRCWMVSCLDGNHKRVVGRYAKTIEEAVKKQKELINKTQGGHT